ncbi:MAG: 2-amino-4-hydroxy-6-hydroxymethyldihydropteridine diphosphokinase [Sphingobacteriales bacterium JAD_PAG50586_3]|nr:MAG: 2-amino-4-hydroxy-6-hydroxymethyldihydropteridine diphosphokinase [Sphingobacteriales bacterium JAD_PAG50586_3]
MKRVFLLLGSNIGNKQEVIITAIRQINSDAGKVVQTSALYETAPWGFKDQDLFLNAVVEIEPSLPPAQLLVTILEIERQLGRTRLVPKNGPRIIDIDILIYGDEIVNTPELTVPHPAMANRRFTLVPLAEIAKDYLHPVLNKTIGQLLNECPDTLTVYPVGTIEWQ